MDGTRKRAAFWQRPMVKWGLKIAQLLLTVAVLSVLVDYWRAPVAPVQAAFTAFQTEKQPALHQSSAACPNPVKESPMQKTTAKLYFNETAILNRWGRT